MQKKKKNPGCKVVIISILVFYKTPEAKVTRFQHEFSGVPLIGPDKPSPLPREAPLAAPPSATTPGLSAQAAYAAASRSIIDTVKTHCPESKTRPTAPQCTPACVPGPSAGTRDLASTASFPPHFLQGSDQTGTQARVVCVSLCSEGPAQDVYSHRMKKGEEQDGH